MWFQRLLVVVALIVGTQGSQWTLVSDETGHYELVDTNQEQLPEVRISEHDVLFYYRSREQREPVLTRLGDTAVLANTDFTSSRPTHIIVHGWHNNNASKLNELVSTAVLEREDSNVFVLDWSVAASSLYVVARAAVPTVGNTVAKYVREIKLDASKLTLTGHSLGAHACGIAGAQLHPSRLVALDPAKPLFELTAEDGRLDSGDAAHVQVIHTCAGMLGWLGPLGHVDWYPGRGGRAQPGCGQDALGSCAHSRSYIYYAESVRNGGFTATACGSYEDFLDGGCNNGIKRPMAGFPLDVTVRGTFYLDVNDRKPFSLG